MRERERERKREGVIKSEKERGQNSSWFFYFVNHSCFCGWFSDSFIKDR